MLNFESAKAASEGALNARAELNQLLSYNENAFNVSVLSNRKT